MNGIAKKANRSIGVVSVLTACVKIYRENVCVDCSVKDLMHAAQFVSGKYDIYEDQTVYDAVKLIIENGLVSIKVNKKQNS